MRQGPQLFAGIGQHSAPSYQNKRFLRIADHFQSHFHIFIPDCILLTDNRFRLLRCVFVLCRSHILCNINKNRARAAALAIVKALRTV